MSLGCDPSERLTTSSEISLGSSNILRPRTEVIVELNKKKNGRWPLRSIRVMLVVTEEG